MCGLDNRKPVGKGPIPKAKWPRWAKLIAKRRYHCEIGVGRTFERLADERGGKWIKRISAALGIPCGCTSRRDEWNVRYSYDQLVNDEASE